MLTEFCHRAVIDSYLGKAELAQHSTDKMRAHASFHTNNATWKLLKHRLQRQPLYLLAQNAMARVIKARPETQDLVTGEFEKKIEGVTSSRESIERRKKELDEIGQRGAHMEWGA